jgi:hypothetical protein
MNDDSMRPDVESVLDRLLMRVNAPRALVFRPDDRIVLERGRTGARPNAWQP